MPLSFRLGLCFLCDPHDVLTASGKLGLLRVDAACGLISAGLQLIESGGAPVISGARSGNLGLRSSRLGCRGLWFRRGLGSCWPDLPGLQFELGRGGVRFFVPGLRLALGRPRSALADGGLLLAVDRAVHGISVHLEVPAPSGHVLRFRCSPGGWLLPATLQLGPGLPGSLPGVRGPGGLFLIPGVRGLQAAGLRGQRGGQRPRVVCAYLVVLYCGVGRLLPGVGLGLRGRT
jgi:hypothetical protein